ncbi:hypothetical protein C5167_001962 [Papaver somniferum]|uniref:Uncharacterized protein n=1 Tax=Papaver somniferum TaxID=3469 RepID=A0A4Y7L0D8_PAPSO|nr:hypothetical protein C5167_001962 [Papaver somniferum]
MGLLFWDDASVSRYEPSCHGSHVNLALCTMQCDGGGAKQWGKKKMCDNDNRHREQVWGTGVGFTLTRGYKRFHRRAVLETFDNRLLKIIQVPVSDIGSHFGRRIKDLEPKVFKAMLHFIYKNTLIEDDELVASRSSCVSDNLVGKILAAADEHCLVTVDRLSQTQQMARPSGLNFYGSRVWDFQTSSYEVRGLIGVWGGDELT